MLRIGILIKDFESLENWELRIIEIIRNDSNLKLALLIKDGRIGDKNIISKNILSEFILKKQISIEKFIYRKNIIETVDRNDIFKYLKTVPSLEVKPISNEFIDVFSEEDSLNIEKYNLDLILKHGFNIINGKIFEIAKHGVWLLGHGDSSQKKGPSCFWEILNKKPVISVTLLQLVSGQRRGFVIDKAYFNPNRHWSFVQTNNSVQESSVSLLFKNINKIVKDKFLISKSLDEFDSLYKSPTIFNCIKYCFNFYSILISKFFEKFSELFGKRYGCWTLFIGIESFMDVDLAKLEPVILPKDEFWADPFLFKYQNQQYVFFESLSYKTKKGKISCGLIDGNNIVNVMDVLELDYHLSYPYIFKENGEIFMMPETMQNNRLEIYRCVNFPDKWELFTTAFEGETVADATFFNDQQNQKWLFVTKKVSINTDTTSELYIYKVDSLKLNNLQPHKQNPVIIDSRIARNAGPIFEMDGKFYRPSQCSSDAIYGKALNINQIEKLNLDKYEEKIIKKVEPSFQKGFSSIHHLHQDNNLFVFDAAYKKK